jgi:hypothetical protein
MDYVEEYDNYKDDNTLVDEDVIKERGWLLWEYGIK